LDTRQEEKEMVMVMVLKDKVAIVTGGGTGIGKAIALELANAGADVAICSRRLATIEEVSQQIKEMGRRSIAIPTDVRIKKQVDSMIEQVVKEFSKVDILINNSGSGRMSPILEMSEDDWDMVIDTNLKGVLLCTQAVAKHMIERKYGKIINISSTCALGAIAVGQSAYTASKFAVVGFTKASARELGPYGINVNAIAPGRIPTPMVYEGMTKEEADAFLDEGKRATTVERVGTPEDIAHLALFLVSDEASFISAELVASNGGRTNLMGR
jgi:NAD(P)-dependent dehydrogenase (short-subunit alcohol dehydrogenase family)